MSDANGTTNDLPPGWRMRRLSEIAAIRPRAKPGLDDDALVTFVPMAAVGEEFSGIVDPEVRRFGDVRTGYTSFGVGDVLFAKITPCMENGKLAVVRGELKNDAGFGSTELTVIRPGSEVTAEWLAHFLSQASFRREAKRNMAGAAGQMRVPKRFLEAAEVPVPPPAEQRRIVGRVEAMLGRVEAGAASLGRARRKVTAYRAAVLKAATAGDLTADWRSARGPDPEPADRLLARLQTASRDRWERDQLAAYAQKNKRPPKNWQSRYQPAAAPDPAALPALPPGWCSASIDQLLHDGSYGTSVKCDYDADGPPVLRIPNIARGELDLADMKYATKDVANADDLALRIGDILICRTNGSVSLVGKAAVVRQPLPTPHLFASYLIRLRLVFPEMAKYLHGVLLSVRGRRYIESHAASSAGQHNVSLTLLKSFPVPLPPLSEQAEIVDRVEERLSVAKAAAGLIDAAAARGVRLRQSILRDAFTGRLTAQPAEVRADVVVGTSTASRT